VARESKREREREGSACARVKMVNNALIFTIHQKKKKLGVGSQR